MFYELFYGNEVTFLILIFSIILGLFAQSNIKRTYAKYSKMKSNTPYTGVEIANMIMEKNNISDVSVVEIAGNLTDHYDPGQKIVRLSSNVYNSNSISAQAIAAHEVGHVIQHARQSKLLDIRTAIFPAAKFSSSASGFFVIFGLIAGATNLLYIGIILLLIGLLFQLATLPVEFDASNRALKQLGQLNLVDEESKEGAKKILTAAALTYVISALVALLQILRLLIIARQND